jgi:DNA-binding NtrC family response regulator
MANAGSILIADDDDAFLHSLATLLRCQGYQCDCASDAYKAVEMLQAGLYDLLISDVNMPGNTNLRLISEAHRLAENMPVILISGSLTLDFPVRPPVIACLSKCGDFDELYELVRISMERSQTCRATASVARP